MRAVTIVGGELEWREHPDPEPKAGEVLVSVEAAGINAADLLQRRGAYPRHRGGPPTSPDSSSQAASRPSAPGSQTPPSAKG